MSDRSEMDFSQPRRQTLPALLPDLVLSIVAPIFIYRLASPYMSATMALLLAGIAPLIPIGIGLWRRRRLNPIGVLSLLTIALKIGIAFIFNDSRWLLLSVSLITGAHGVIMLASLLTPRPLLLWLIENTLSGTPTGQPLLHRFLDEAPRQVWTVVTGVWGIALLLECGVNVMLALTLSVDLFLVVSPLVRYGFLGSVLLGTFLFGWIRRQRKHKRPEASSRQLTHEVTQNPLPR